MSKSYPRPGAFVPATVVQWDQHCLIAVDDIGLPYIHWYNDDMRWQTIWSNYKNVEKLPIQIRVGRNDGPRGRKAFISHLLVDQPELPNLTPDTRSPYETFTVSAKTVQRDNEESSDEPENLSSIHVRFETENASWLRKEAKANGISVKEMANRCVRQAMAMRGAL